MKIWKYDLAVAADLQSIAIPEGAQLLAVQSQFNQPRLWALVDENAPLRWRELATYGTGHPLPDIVGKYIGTYQIQEGDFVFHVFEVLP